MIFFSSPCALPQLVVKGGANEHSNKSKQSNIFRTKYFGI